MHYHREYKIPHIIGCGVLKLKTHLFFEKWGYQYVKHNGKILDPILMSTRIKDRPIEVVLMHLEKFSEYALKTADRYQKLWEERIELLPPSQEEGDPQERRKDRRLAHFLP